MTEHKLHPHTPDKKKRPVRYLISAVAALGGVAMFANGEINMGLLVFGGALLYAFFS